METHGYRMGIIGNCSYLAYIDDTSNVQWMCMPRFDSSFLFGSLLDEDRGGEFSIKPSHKDFQSKQYYLTNTNILVTEFHMPEGSYRVIDYAPRFYQHDRYFKPLMLFRKVELIDGSPFVKVICRPVIDYGKMESDLVAGSNHIRYMNFDTHVRLTTDVPLSYILNEKAFVLNENKYLVFSYGLPLEASLEETAENFLKKTVNYWTEWIKSTSIPNIYQDAVIRSALVLKLHQYEDTGAVIAAGTTSLPEAPGTERTWDYRFCWMRDTYYTLNAFNHIGHFEELEKYSHFIENLILNEKQQIKPLYTVLGYQAPEEKYLDLRGYLGNRPVRIGNNAVRQVQNDVYGQILVSLMPLFVDRRLNYADTRKAYFFTSWLLERIYENIDMPDAGLWEFGTTRQHHCYTHLFNWAGAKAAIKVGKILKKQELIDKSEAIIKKASDYIEKCYRPDIKAYAQATGGSHLDASSLQLITMNYLDPASQIARTHIEAHEKELFSNGLYLRYKFDDIGKADKSFIICGFWFAEALAANGQLEKAARVIEDLMKCSNHLGLFSEDADSEFNQWGNFPQTYSHVGLMNAVYRLAIKLDRPMFFD